MNKVKYAVQTAVNVVSVPTMFLVVFPPVWAADKVYRTVDDAIQRYRFRVAWRRIERSLEPIADLERLR